MKTPVGSKHRGYIEQFFGSAHWKRCMKAGANNYTGNNITAKGRGVNVDMLDANKNNRPAIGDEAFHQIENFFYRLRCMPQSNGVSKQEEWLEAWAKLTPAQKRPIDDQQFLLKFGIEHNYKGEGIRISNRGVEPRINGVKYSYDLEKYDLEHIGKTVSILYDPADMSRVLVTDFDRVRLLAYDARLASRTLEDSSEGSRTYLNTLFLEKKEIVAKVSAKAEQRKQILLEQAIDAETVLQAGIMVKDIKQGAEDMLLSNMIEDYSNTPSINNIVDFIDDQL